LFDYIAYTFFTKQALAFVYYPSPDFDLVDNSRSGINASAVHKATSEVYYASNNKAQNSE